MRRSDRAGFEFRYKLRVLTHLTPCFIELNELQRFMSEHKRGSEVQLAALITASVPADTQEEKAGHGVFFA